MSIIKSLQEFIESYEGIEQLKTIPKVNTDQLDDELSSYALVLTGNGQSHTDITGNRYYEHNYVFRAKEAASDEVNRGENQDFLQDFSDWLEEQNEADNLPVLPGRYVAESIEASNAMLFDVEADGAGIYQVQIKLILKKGRR